MQDSKKISKNALHTILFFVILFFLFLIASKIISHAVEGNENLVHDRNKSLYRLEKEPENTLDVVVLGDSLSYTAFSPIEWWNQHGVTGFVFGQPGQKLQESYQMLKSVYEHQSPRVVVLETNAMYRAGEGKLQDIMDAVEAWANNYIVIYRGHDIWKSLVTEKDFSQENYKGFGFRCTIDPYLKGNYMKPTDKVKPLTDTAEDYLAKIRELCEDHGTELILVSSPSPKNNSYRHHNAIAAYAEANDIPYLDMNLLIQELGIDWYEDSLDGGDHLNLRGGLKVSRYLGDYLHEHYDLPDHRGDRDYAEWQLIYIKYASRVEEELAQMKRFQ